MATAENEDPPRIRQRFAIPAPLSINGKAGHILAAPGRTDALQGLPLSAALHLSFPN